LKFETLGFSGKWKAFIGDPAAGFSAMISGKPKMGKSYLCADFAGYLARHHGETLYVAGEEKLGDTLQQKMNAVKHACLHVTGTLPQDLSPYSFVVIDSVTRLGLNAENLRRLKAMNPDTSFIYVFQVTKNGQFRGENNFQHDVDVVIEVPEKGKAVQYGRYNQGGEMEIFSQMAM
jgi:predicted ATP-dependent serine protease